MNSDQVIGWMIVACILFIVFIFFSNYLKNVSKICVNSIIGVSGIFIANFIFNPMGISVGINLFTVIITGILGFPGLVSLYIINALL